VSDFHDDCKRQLVSAAATLFAAPAAPAAPAARPDGRVGAGRRIGRRRHVPLLAAIALGALLLAAAALAATQVIGFGNPVTAPRAGGRERPSVSTGIGVPVAGAKGSPVSAQPLAISVPDPGGGLRWGMRIVRTTRGLSCLQIGRLLDGRLGVIGQDGEFDDDGRFHELPATVLEPGPCIAPTVWTILSDVGVPAAGALTTDPLSCRPPWLRAWPSSPKPCPAGDERLVGFGVLGPHAVSVSYMVDGKLRTVPTVGALGAYLIVLRVPPKLRRNAPGLGGKAGLLGGFPIGAGKGAVVSRMLFRYGGRVCQTGFDRELHGPPQCTSHVTRARVLVPRILRGLHAPVALKARRAPGGYDVEVTFTAPASVTSASVAYGIEVTAPSGPACGRGGTSGQSLERDVARGQILHMTEFVPQPPGCHGVVHGEVVLGSETGALHLVGGDETIGRFSFTLP
jgi:hypothetical protein